MDRCHPHGIESPIVAAIELIEYVAPSSAEESLERDEVDWLLTSGVLGRSANLARVLSYICEEHFAGRALQIKEYTIATQALGRRSDFDPQTDTIVRVTVHSLRKRLLDVYQNEGSARTMRLVLPPGHYNPSFIPARKLEPTRVFPAKEPGVSLATETGLEPINPTLFAATPPVHRTQLWRLGVIALASVIVVSAVWALRSQQVRKLRPVEVSSLRPGLPLPQPQTTIRALLGSGRKPYVDRSGQTWTVGNYCEAGTNVAVPTQSIQGTEDASIYLGGVRGIVRCTFPVTRDLYEIHFHFAETSDLAAATHVATLSVNAGPTIRADVVDDAGGDGIATSTVLTGIAPEHDGAIHLDFTSEVSPLNAIEILPAPSASLLPVRIVVNSKPYLDSAGQFWLSDRYFSGGRHGMPPETAQRSSLGLYGANRVGRFHYSIPAVPYAYYKVRLYFHESWFGKENGGNGGPGSRVFDVACNGQLLLKDYDILAQEGSAQVVKTFDHIQASAGGRIDLAFMPVVNYAMVNAIEILPEDPAPNSH
jgi:Malectin domain